jgi:membrane-associated phospholipid phosphatase
MAKVKFAESTRKTLLSWSLVLVLVLRCGSTFSQEHSMVSVVDTVSVESFPLPSDKSFPINEKVVRKPISYALKTGAIATLGAGTWIATYALVDEPIQQFAQAYRNIYSDNISKTVEPLGHQKYIMPFAGAALASGIILKDKKLQKLGLVTAGSILANAYITSTLKNTFHRYRPIITTENHVYGVAGDGHTSLPSGHTSTAFTAAASIALVYGEEYKFVPPLVYSVATLVGLSRINDNMHWATDVMAGAFVGYATARGVNYLYDAAANRLINHQKHTRLMVTPLVSSVTKGINAKLVF